MTDIATSSEPRARIVDAAARLLQEQGPSAVTTRGVAHAAGVQAPAIYRLFGDKDGLLEAVAEHVMSTFVSTKAAVVEAAEAEGVDPVADLRAGWQGQVEFGLGNPTLFRLLSDPTRVSGSPAARLGKRVLEARIHRVAVAGRLRVAENRAVALFQTAGVGVITTLLATPPDERDPGLADAVLNGVLAQMLTDAPAAPDAGPRAAAVALRAVAPTLDALTTAEQQLLSDWLDRVIAAS
ncbi:TetR/AcrR family transcriptional regulator [Frondihabitans cladoniiphilus]|uniref:TetR/AcrR family transcriptional regulator n=1 Tax=Frondihabitans cladoniiphilus TaxID=715785 RepID=A0ABP8VN84_9MICO